MRRAATCRAATPPPRRHSSAYKSPAHSTPPSAPHKSAVSSGPNTTPTTTSTEPLERCTVTETILTSGRDAWVDSTHQSKNYGTGYRLIVENGSAYALVWIRNPAVKG